MIDEEGRELYSKMMGVIRDEEDCISDAVNEVMAAFDKYMNTLNKTKGMLYSKNGEVLMKC